MIPILYENTEAQYTTNGLGRLADIISCTVTEERNGVYECEFEYPITGGKYADILEGRQILVTHDDTGDTQPFVIYGRSAPISGVVTFYAHHVSYALRNTVVMPFTASSIAGAMTSIGQNCLPAGAFTFWTDKTTTGNFKLTEPKAVRSVLGGEEGSLLDVYGTGEYLWDKHTVKLYLHRGTDSGVEIRYGKNLSDLTNEIDAGDVYNAVVPFWYDEENNQLVMLPEVYIDDGSGDPLRIIPMDLSGDFEDAPTAAQLRTLATSKFESAEGWIPKQNVKVDFVHLWETEEYKEYAPLQRVRLCDTVSVYYPELGVTAEKTKVVRVVYNVLLDRYDEIELGELQPSYASAIAESFDTSQFITDYMLNQLRKSINAIIDDLEEQIDEKLETWAQATNPAAVWTAAERPEHNGDLWLYTGTSNITVGSVTIHPQGVYQYDGANNTWVAYSSTTSNLFDLADGKTTIFYGSPSGSYSNKEVGDYLVDSTDGCTYRWNGTAWIKLTDYAAAISSMQTTLEAAIDHATDLISGGLGGYVYLKPNANGQPEEILIMDTPNINTAVKVIRMNQNGIAFSSNGYSGPFVTAWTIDGAFVADFITSGTLNANIIKAGVLSDSGGNTTFDLSTGELDITTGSIDLGNGMFTVDDNGDMVANSIDIGGFKLAQDVDGEYALYKDSTVNGVKYRTWIRSGVASEGRETWAISTQIYKNGGWYSTFQVRADGDLLVTPLSAAGSTTFSQKELEVSTNEVRLQWTNNCFFAADGDGIWTQYSPTRYFLADSDGVYMEYSSSRLFYADADGIHASYSAQKGFYANANACGIANSNYNYVECNGSTGVRIQGGQGTAGITATPNTVDITSGSRRIYLTNDDIIVNPGTTVSTGVPNVRLVDGNSALRYTSHANSSRKIKTDITNEYNKDIAPERLYDVDVVQFKYKDGIVDPEDSRAGIPLLGFIIEDLNEVYPNAVDKENPDDSINWGWNSTYIIPPMLKLIQDQKKEIDELRAEIKAIKEALK